MYGAFQTAFQLNAFQILSAGVAPVAETIVGDQPTRHSHELYERRQRELEAKQELIIQKKLEAQALLVRQAEEAQREQTKQTARQLAAMRKAKALLEKEIEDEMRLLAALDEQMRINRHNDEMLALILACPFFTIH